jgi:hypothetical protein
MCASKSKCLACIIRRKTIKLFNLADENFNFLWLEKRICGLRRAHYLSSSVIDARTATQPKPNQLIFLTRFGERKNRGSSSIEYPARIGIADAGGRSHCKRDDFWLFAGERKSSRDENFTCTSGSLVGAVRAAPPQPTVFDKFNKILFIPARGDRLLVIYICVCTSSLSLSDSSVHNRRRKKMVTLHFD